MIMGLNPSVSIRIFSSNKNVLFKKDSRSLNPSVSIRIFSS